MAVYHNMESVNILQNISCVPQRMTWGQLNDDNILVLGWTVPLSLAKKKKKKREVLNQNLGRLMFIQSTLQAHARHNSFMKSLKLFEEKKQCLWERLSPLNMCQLSKTASVETVFFIWTGDKFKYKSHTLTNIPDLNHALISNSFTSHLQYSLWPLSLEFKSALICKETPPVASR